MHFSKKNKFIAIVSAILIVLVLIFAYFKKSENIIDFSTYKTLIENSLIDSAKIDNRYVYLKSGENEYKIPKETIDLNELYKNVPVSVKEDYSFIYDSLLIAIVALFFGYLIYYTKKREKEHTLIKHQINIAQPEVDDFSSKIRPIASDIKFKDVAGIDEVKEELLEIIDFLKNPKKFIDFGVRLPRGVLLVGPPGVGKTMIAKAVAGEADVPFFYQSGSAFVQIYVGMGAKRVRELFAKAKEMAPSIIFIDEIDAVGKARGSLRNDEREATLNQLLTEMDGFEDSSGVIVIAATNKIDMLDEALLRPGRFDRRIFVSLPNAKEREEILKVYLKKIPHFVDLEKLSKMTVGFSGAALSSLVNEAALHALKKDKKIVQMSDFEAVREKVLFGKKKILAFSEKEKEIQATYQAAKALSAYWYEIDFEKISILGGGFKDIDKEIISKNEFLAKIKFLLSGYAAMKIFYNEEFSNSFEDVHRAKMIAEEMVLKYSMGDKILGSQQDIAVIIDSSLNEAKELLSSQKDKIVKIRDFLIENESIDYEQIKEILKEDEIF